MKQNNKGLSFLLILASALTLSACGITNTKASNSDTTMPSQQIKKAATMSAESEQRPEEKQMQLADIQSGNFTSVEGTWKEIARSMNHIKGSTGPTTFYDGDSQLLISDTTISTLDFDMTGDTLTDNNGEHLIEFKKEKEVLSTSMLDSVAINWKVLFYPKGTTAKVTEEFSLEEETQEMIVIWTSNNNLTLVFTRESPTDLTDEEFLPLQLDQLDKNDFSSLIGTWTNPTDGKTMTITDQIETRQMDSPAIVESGAVIKDTEANGYSTIISSGDRHEGYMIGLIGTYDPAITFSPFAPIAIVPQGVAMNEQDSDTSQDRLVIGAGQSDISENTYYRE